MTIRGKAPILKSRKRRCRQNGQPPTWITRSNRRLGRPGGYFLLLACKNRAIMATTRIPVWIRSEYVTIGSPPFRGIRGQEAPPTKQGTNRLPFIDSAGIRIPQKKEERKAAALRSSFFACCCQKSSQSRGWSKGRRYGIIPASPSLGSCRVGGDGQYPERKRQDIGQKSEARSFGRKEERGRDPLREKAPCPCHAAG